MSGAPLMLSIINNSLESGVLSSDVVKLSVDEISEDLANLRTTGEISNDAFLEAGIIQGGLNVLSNMIEQDCSAEEIRNHLKQLTARAQTICSAYPSLSETLE